MNRVAMTIRKEGRYKHEKAHITFVVSLLLILLISSSYIVTGELVDIRGNAEKIQSELALYDDVESVITEELSWR